MRAIISSLFVASLVFGGLSAFAASEGVRDQVELNANKGKLNKTCETGSTKGYCKPHKPHMRRQRISSVKENSIKEESADQQYARKKIKQKPIRAVNQADYE